MYHHTLPQRGMTCDATQCAADEDSRPADLDEQGLWYLASLNRHGALRSRSFRSVWHLQSLATRFVSHCRSVQLSAVEMHQRFGRTAFMRVNDVYSESWVGSLDQYLIA